MRYHLRHRAHRCGRSRPSSGGCDWIPAARLTPSATASSSSVLRGRAGDRPRHRGHAGHPASTSPGGDPRAARPDSSRRHDARRRPPAARACSPVLWRLAGGRRREPRRATARRRASSTSSATRPTGGRLFAERAGQQGYARDAVDRPEHRPLAEPLPGDRLARHRPDDPIARSLAALRRRHRAGRYDLDTRNAGSAPAMPRRDTSQSGSCGGGRRPHARLGPRARGRRRLPPPVRPRRRRATFVFDLEQEHADRSAPPASDPDHLVTRQCPGGCRLRPSSGATRVTGGGHRRPGRATATAAFGRVARSRGGAPVAVADGRPGAPSSTRTRSTPSARPLPGVSAGAGALGARAMDGRRRRRWCGDQIAPRSTTSRAAPSWVTPSPLARA